MQQLIATYIGAILTQLQPDAVRSPADPEPPPMLRATAAAWLSGGNRLIDTSGNPHEANWAVFAKTSEDELFAFRRWIDSSVDPQSFVASTYRAMLNRSADPEGLSSYCAALVGGILTHAEFLRTMAESTEAQQAAERLLIVADPSPFMVTLRASLRNNVEVGTFSLTNEEAV